MLKRRFSATDPGNGRPQSGIAGLGHNKSGGSSRSLKDSGLKLALLRCRNISKAKSGRWTGGGCNGCSRLQKRENLGPTFSNLEAT
jgi:hypothetical protein